MKAGDIARRTRAVTARDIELFTELTGDRNPLHYDEERAGASRFGGIIVHWGHGARPRNEVSTGAGGRIAVESGAGVSPTQPRPPDRPLRGQAL